MSEIEIILNSYSLGDASYKLFGYANKKSTNKIEKILNNLGYSKDLFIGKNKMLKFERIEKECPICNKKFIAKIGHKREKKTCSISCSNSLIPKRLKNANNIKKISNNKRAKKFNCLVCLKSFETYTSRNIIKACSKVCRDKHQSNLMSERVENGEHKGWISRCNISYPEQYFMGVLNNLGIKYEHNFAIAQKKLGSDNGYYYALDFYILKGNIKIDLEIDGKQHNLLERKESDIKRDKLLTNNNYKIYRIKWENLRNKSGKEYIRNEINKFKDWYYKL